MRYVHIRVENTGYGKAGDWFGEPNHEDSKKHPWNTLEEATARIEYINQWENSNIDNWCVQDLDEIERKYYILVKR